MNIKILKQSEQNHIKINNNNLSIVLLGGRSENVEVNPKANINQLMKIKHIYI